MVTKKDIEIFIHQRGKVSWTALENFFAVSPRSKKETKYVCPECKSFRINEDQEARELVCSDCGFVLRSIADSDCRIAKQTLLNYVNELVCEGKIEKIIDDTTLRPVYKTSEKAKKEVENNQAKKDIMLTLETMPPEEITKLHDIFMSSNIFELSTSKNNQTDITMPSKDIAALREIIFNINTRRRLQKLKAIGAPLKVMEIGLQILTKGNEVNKVDLFKFYYYPITEFDAQVWRNYAEYSKKSGKSDPFGDMIEAIKEEDPEYMKSVISAQAKLLKHSAADFIKEYRAK
jgi:DNA-directed RNA polymerase subunit RPC12/RpoP